MVTPAPSFWAGKPIFNGCWPRARGRQDGARSLRPSTFSCLMSKGGTLVDRLGRPRLAWNVFGSFADRSLRQLSGAGHASKRYPIPASVIRCSGCDGSSSSLRRSCARYTRR